ncbi:hypothetical protein DPMN_165540 [Dreissena polymorpha]|uniref:Uncharacterized protein n=1 Tax=Dreissena polymorpha TaxID=45954 RepID=A0A9D4ITC5_DREPO|nr:hypothetical protein DPMN_165540 [Dreissena polymorpha]
MSLRERRSLGSVGFVAEGRGNNWVASGWSLRKEGITWLRQGVITIGEVSMGSVGASMRITG